MRNNTKNILRFISYLPAILVCVVFFSLIFITTTFAINQWDEGYDVENNVTKPVKVTSSQNCHIVRNNNSGDDYFVPTKTQSEWNELGNNLPRGVSLINASWLPSRGSKCNGESLTQTNECGGINLTTGTSCCSHYSSSCSSNDVYWYNACNIQEDVKQNCGNSGYTSSNFCWLNDVFRQYTTKGCSGASCTSSMVNQKQVECGSPGCINGSCCIENNWSPSTSSYCSGTRFTQTSNCGTTRSATGTKCCVSSWSPSTSSYCSGTRFTQTSNCGTTRSATGTKCCVSSWSPSTSSYCSGTRFTQTSNCGTTRSATGTKYCCTVSSWSPSTSNYCSGTRFTQTSNCGTTRSATGTKSCCTNCTSGTTISACSCSGNQILNCVTTCTRWCVNSQCKESCTTSTQASGNYCVDRICVGGVCTGVGYTGAGGTGGFDRP